MKEPKKPNFTEEELKEMNQKLEEYNQTLYDATSRNRYIENNTSSKIKNLKVLKTIIYTLIDILFYGVLVITFVYSIYELYKEFSFFCILFVAVPMIIVYSILAAIREGLKGLFNFKQIDEEEKRYYLEYQHLVAKKYEKYIEMKRQLDHYESDLKQYNIYCMKLKKEYWYHLDGHQFEKEVAIIFKNEGFDTKVSKVGADGGVDIVLSKDNKRYAVQCKAHTSKVSESVARDLYGVLHAKKFDGGYLVTLNGVSSKTKEFCKRNKDKPIVIWTIKDIMQKYNK